MHFEKAESTLQPLVEFPMCVKLVLTWIYLFRRQIGVRTGTLFAVVAIAGLISNPIGGALITKWKGNFTGLKIFCGIMCLGGYVFPFAANERSLTGTVPPSWPSHAFDSLGSSLLPKCELKYGLRRI